MGFFEHLEELRGTLIKCAIVFAIFAALIGYFMKEFNVVLLWPLHTVQAENPKVVIDLGTTTVMEGFNVVIQMCFLGGVVLSAPFMLFFLGQFVAPALTGFLVQWTGNFTSAFVLTGVIAALGAIFVAIFVRAPKTHLQLQPGLA